MSVAAGSEGRGPYAIRRERGIAGPSSTQPQGRTDRANAPLHLRGTPGADAPPAVGRAGFQAELGRNRSRVRLTKLVAPRISFQPPRLVRVGVRASAHRFE